MVEYVVYLHWKVCKWYNVREATQGLSTKLIILDSGMSLTKDGCFHYKENEIIEMKNSNFEKLEITEIEIDEINDIGQG